MSAAKNSNKKAIYFLL